MKPKLSLSALHEIKTILRKSSLSTVCEEANCPNISTCFSKKTATVLIMGKICTRNCRFCNISSGSPLAIDKNEPENIAKLVEQLNLKHLVITSVTRDDIKDGGSSHFISCIREVKNKHPQTTIEVLIPDFKGDFKSIKKILDQDIIVFNHNIEMSQRLYNSFRKGASFEVSMKILEKAKEYGGKYKTKSGFMVGLGEEVEEIQELIFKLAEIKLDMLTIGQYYMPSKQHAPLVKVYSEEEFSKFREIALNAGIKFCYSASNVRSSFNAIEALNL